MQPVGKTAITFNAAAPQCVPVSMSLRLSNTGAYGGWEISHLRFVQAARTENDDKLFPLTGDSSTHLFRRTP
jgi:hypothetical protein